ncbi:MAG: DUF192 domain-containing protein [Proteobacteria bacterium]|nr:DUF192 domain-containing protein [Pseudomonadota bacterium]
MLASLAACSAHAAGPYVVLDGHRFQIEVAADDPSRERGLMFRESMPADHGMLFIFDDAQVRTFWMKNTHIPLDILYFDQNYKLVSVQQRVPPCLNSGNNCPVYPSEGDARYVLELNAGMAGKLGIKPGDVLSVHR